MTKTKEPYSLCRECKHIKVRTHVDRMCKLNCVYRAITDTCCWTGKRYPCKFEPKDHKPKLTTGLEVLDELDSIYCKLIEEIDRAYPKIMPERERGQIIGLLDARVKIQTLREKVIET